MIRIVQGNPGSGKSYYAVNYLSKFCKYDALYKDHLLNESTLVISNLEGLKIKHIDLEAELLKMPLEEFFTIENFEKLIKWWKCKHIVLIVDEAQKFFDSKFYDKGVFYFFQYHRHIGIDIFLVTQSASTVSRQLLPLCEFIIEAAPRSKGLMGTFRYKFKDVKGNFMYSQVVKKKDDVFAMYKSFSSDEAEKPKNVITHWAIVAVVMMVVVVFGFKAAVAGFTSKGHKPPAASGSPSLAAVPRPIPAAAPSAVPAALPAPVFAPVPASPPIRSRRSASSGIPPLPRPVRPASVAAPSESSDYSTIWRRYPVEGTVEVNGQKWYQIKGQMREASRCRDYDGDSNSVEFFGRALSVSVASSASLSAIPSKVAPVPVTGS